SWLFILLHYSPLVCSTFIFPLFALSTPLFFLFFFYCSGHHRDLHSFPTRRSSDLELRHRASTDGSQQRKNEALKRLQVVESFRADRKSTRLNSSHVSISYAVFCLKKKKKKKTNNKKQKKEVRSRTESSPRERHRQR